MNASNDNRREVPRDSGGHEGAEVIPEEASRNFDHRESEERVGISDSIIDRLSRPGSEDLNLAVKYLLKQHRYYIVSVDDVFSIVAEDLVDPCLICFNVFTWTNPENFKRVENFETLKESFERVAMEWCRKHEGYNLPMKFRRIDILWVDDHHALVRENKNPFMEH